ncbi:hypothetical protein Acr_09g0001760 [Actinidia rufa]|uniref:Uncharacterized protein n=1 Tax=Actinidia rufa TaxID=165716 RepID=A0A7J0F4X5_9ERIC|nr:hypothetical protein Acr_09g0001760 [Actinidia rufa]
MSTEVTQLSSSPREDPPSHEDSPLVDTRPSLERVTNTMTQGELDCLRESCSISTGIQIRLPGSLMQGEVSAARWCCGDFTSLLFSLTEFRNLFGLFNNPKLNSGWLYFKARPKKNSTSRQDRRRPCSGGTQQCQGVEEEILLHIGGQLGVPPRAISGCWRSKGHEVMEHSRPVFV